MAEEMFFLGEHDRRILKKIIEREKKTPTQRPIQASPYPLQLPQTPDVVICFTPPAGIPALSQGEDTGTGTGSGGGLQDDTPGSAYCDLYKIQGEGASALLVPYHTNKLIYNLSTTDIPGFAWRQVNRAKSGHWLVVGDAGVSGSDGTSGTLFTPITQSTTSTTLINSTSFADLTNTSQTFNLSTLSTLVLTWHCLVSITDGGGLPHCVVSANLNGGQINPDGRFSNVGTGATIRGVVSASHVLTLSAGSHTIKLRAQMLFTGSGEQATCGGYASWTLHN